VAIAIELRGVGKRYRLGGRQESYLTLREALRSLWRRRSAASGAPLWALRNIDLEVRTDEVVGIIGRNGAGKSTLLKLITGITPPTTGSVRTRGRVGALLEVGTGFHPELTGRENVFLNAAVLGMSRREARRHFPEIVEFAEVEDFIDTPLKRYSSGMRMRLAFAVAAHIRPPIVVVDEILAVADAEFQRRCLGKMAEIGGAERTVLFVSHDLGAVARLCPRVVWIDRGQVRADGLAAEVIEQYVAATSAQNTRVDLRGSEGRIVQLVEAATVDALGAEAGPVRGDPLRIQVSFALLEEVRGLDLSVWIEDRWGHRLIDESWADRTGGVPVEDFSPGEYTVVLSIPPVLPAGQYVTGVWFGTEYDDYVKGPIMHIDVLPRVEDRQEQLVRRRVVQPPVTWELRQDRAG